MEKNWLSIFETQWLVRHQTELIATLIIIILYFIIKTVAKKLARRYGALTNKNEARVLQMRKVISILVNTIFIVIVAIVWGVNGQNVMLGMTAIFTFLGVALFAQWSMISNVTAGIFIYFSAPYRLGDNIVIIDKDTPIEARIEDIKTIYTHLRTAGGELIVMPNNTFLQKQVMIKKEE